MNKMLFVAASLFLTAVPAFAVGPAKETPQTKHHATHVNQHKESGKHAVENKYESETATKNGDEAQIPGDKSIEDSYVSGDHDDEGSSDDGSGK